MNPFPRWYLNSLFLAVLVTVVGTAMTTLAAYSFSRFRFRSRRTLLQSVLLIQVFPNFLNMVALFLILQQIGARLPLFGLNTYGGLLLVYWGGTLGANTWLTKGYFDSIPRDLDEAAMVDGASAWQIFARVLLPLVRPILVVVGLLTFIATYSEYVLAKVLLTDKMMYTLAVGLNAMVANQFAQSWGVFQRGRAVGFAAHADPVSLLPALPGGRAGGRLGQGLEPCSSSVRRLVGAASHVRGAAPLFWLTPDALWCRLRSVPMCRLGAYSN